MLSLPPSVRILLARDPVDCRKAFDGLCQVVRDVVGDDPFSGALFLFFTRRRNPVKVLAWGENAFWLFAQRLEHGLRGVGRGGAPGRGARLGAAAVAAGALRSRCAPRLRLRCRARCLRHGAPAPVRPRLRPPGVALDPQRQAEGFEGLALQHFYRTAAFLSDVRGDLERELLFRDRDLFSQSVDVVFLDTTSLYVYRDSETPMRRWGCSRDRRGDLPQFVLCVVVDGVGWPIAWEILPGNTADPVATHHVVVKRRERFDIRSAVVVADRGTISKATVAMLGDHASAPFQYVLGCRMRRSREIRSEVLTVDLDGQRSRLHTDFKGAANAAFAAAGVRVPSAVTHLGTIPPPAADPQAEAAV